MAEDLAKEDRNFLLELARRTIQDGVAGGERVYPAMDNPVFKEKRGVFVTLHREGKLRGCIGYPLPIKPLLEAVVDNSLSAALEDPRFPPVGRDEVDDLEIEISILSVPVEVSGPESVEVGRDGIIISKGFSRGLLLPQVPVEQGWSREEFISFGCQKAGLPADEWKKGVKIETFQALVLSEN
jgi:AmmeMemoRadiSam system protein A